MEENKNNTYNNNSISSLKGADRVRLRPSVIFGSDGIEGCQHTISEILANSIDEFKDGYGSTIYITRNKDYSFEIKDMGRGVPLDWNENEQRYNWELIFNELYAGGKYNNSNENNYEFSLGLNGLGSASVCYASSFLKCISYRDGFKYEINFKEGVPQGKLIKEKYDYEHTGTIITYKPDSKVFTDTNISMDWIKSTCKMQTIVNKGLKIIVKDEIENTEIETYYINGIQDYIKEICPQTISDYSYFEKESYGKDREDKQEYKVKYEVAFTFTNTDNLLKYYHNSSYLEYGGSPDKAVKNAFVYMFDKYLKNNNLYNKDEKKVTFIDIQDSLTLIVNSYSTSTSYENQTKKAITNKFIQETITQGIKDYLEAYFKENVIEAEKIAKQILANKRSREKAERTRINVRKQLSGNIDIGNRIKKFVDCRSKDVNKRELYIVEGDSALGSCKLGRNAEFQGIMPVRGKILNCLKADYDKIFKSDIIIDLLKVLGCGVEVKSKKNKELNTFDINNLRWSKIIICTDADVDGYQSATRS